MTFNISKYSVKQIQTARQIYEFWIGVGLTASQACGMLAQADAESSFNFKAVGDHGEAFGLHQMHTDRIKLINEGCGIDISKLPPVLDQLKGIWYELQHSEHGALKHIRATTNATDAGQVACKYYERPASAQEPLKRGVTSKGWYDYFTTPVVAQSMISNT